MKFIQLGEHYFNPDEIAVIRESSLDEEQTIIYTTGQSATEGFCVDLTIDEVLELIDEHWLSGIDEALASPGDE
jgi:hypothetical protein